MDKYIVYKHTTPSGKIYIGITRRKAEERWLDGRGYKYNKHFYNAIKKYGWDNIKHEILLKDLQEHEAKEMERFFIQLYKSYDHNFGYNKTLGGDANAINVEKQILQYDLNGKFIRRFNTLTEASAMTQTTISKISNCAHGVRFSSNGFIWVFADDKNKEEKIQKCVLEKAHPSAMCGGANHQAKPVEQYSLDGKYIRTYESAQTAADYLGINYSAIKKCASERDCDKRTKSAGGFIWLNAETNNKHAALKQRIIKGCEKPVSQYTKDGCFIRDFESIVEATKSLNIKSSHISDVCNGKRRIAHGYIWKWKQVVHEDSKLTE